VKAAASTGAFYGAFNHQQLGFKHQKYIINYVQLVFFDWESTLSKFSVFFTIQHFGDI
jgi:hypothetical protein